jgi:uncharacterized protein (DUF736 family)
VRHRENRRHSQPSHRVYEVNGSNRASDIGVLWWNQSLKGEWYFSIDIKDHANPFKGFLWPYHGSRTMWEIVKSVEWRLASRERPQSPPTEARNNRDNPINTSLSPPPGQSGAAEVIMRDNKSNIDFGVSDATNMDFVLRPSAHFRHLDNLESKVAGFFSLKRIRNSTEGRPLTFPRSLIVYSKT